MAKKLILTLTAVVLGICLLSGGCNSSRGADRVQELKDLLKTSLTREPVQQPATSIQDLLPEASVSDMEQVEVTLYYGDQYDKGLVAETRNIEKTPGIARRTVQELFKGPAQAGHKRLFPEGTQLLDINIKDDGLCIVDVSNHIRNVPAAEQTNLMVYSLVNTLGEYPSIKEVSLLIGGEDVSVLNSVDLSQPFMPDYDLAP